MRKLEIIVLAVTLIASWLFAVAIIGHKLAS